MPIEESSEDNQVCGIIIAITNGKKSEDIIDFYKVGDKVFFKKWAGVKIHPSQISEKPAAHQLVVVPINDLVGRVVNDNHSDKQNKELDNA